MCNDLKCPGLSELGRIVRRDFHTLGAADVDILLAAANRERYRAPRVRNGSRARYYHAALQRRFGRVGATSR